MQNGLSQIGFAESVCGGYSDFLDKMIGQCALTLRKLSERAVLMCFNFKVTELLISITGKFVNADNYNVITEGHKNYWGVQYTADYVQIIDDPLNLVGFEVTENEIIIFFFTDHVHFNDYATDLEDNEPNYVERATEFLENIFTLPIERRYTMKGNRVICDESLFIKSQTEKDSCAGVTFCFAGIKNLFKRKREFIEIKRFNKTIGSFTTERKCYNRKRMKGY